LEGFYITCQTREEKPENNNRRKPKHNPVENNQIAKMANQNKKHHNSFQEQKNV
jgi:hypothetical protein